VGQGLGVRLEWKHAHTVIFPIKKIQVLNRFKEATRGIIKNELYNEGFIAIGTRSGFRRL
jgi:hypothetical protein